MVGTDYLKERINETNKEIYDLGTVCKICVALLEFDHFAEQRRYKLISLINEVVDKKHYGKTEDIRQLAAKSTGVELGNHVENTVKGRIHDEYKASEIYNTYFAGIYRPEDVQRILNDTINKIILLQERVSGYKEEIEDAAKREKEREQEERRREQERNREEAERKRQLEQQQKSIRSYTYDENALEREFDADVPHIRRTPVTKEEVSQRRAVVKIEKKEQKLKLKVGYYLEKEELDLIKQRFGLENISNLSHSFISDRTIQEIVRLYEVEEALKRKDKNLGPKSIGKALEDIYRLAILEAEGEYLEEPLATNMKRLCNNYGGLDFVGRYNNLYSLINEYIRDLPSKDRQGFRNRIFGTEMGMKASELYEDGLASPTMFRFEVNSAISDYILDNGKPEYFTKIYLDQLRHNTKYMNADEVARLVIKTKDKYQWYSNNSSLVGKAEEVCAELIMDRMIGANTEDAEIDRDVRIASIYWDYFNSTGGPDIHANLAEEGYAKKLVAQQELISEKKKQYFGMGKFKRSFSKMDFSRLVKLSRKTELTNKEEAEIRGMF